MRQRLFALLTDFGSADPYVAQVKAVIHHAYPAATIIDLSHDVSPYDLAQAGFFLAASLPYFPPGSVFLAVVDPGVGTARRIVLLQVQDRFVIVPDNGLASLLARPSDQPALQAWDLTGWVAPLSASATFHGRDVFAPLAARLAARLDAGESPDGMGPTLPSASLVRLAWAEPVTDGPFLLARVLHVDRFGNCVLNLAAEPWRERLARLPGLELLSPSVRGLERVRTYAEISSGAVAVLAGSQGFLELAMRQDSAALALDLAPGRDVRLAAVGAAV